MQVLANFGTTLACIMTESNDLNSLIASSLPVSNTLWIPLTNTFLLHDSLMNRF